MMIQIKETISFTKLQYWQSAMQQKPEVKCIREKFNI